MERMFEQCGGMMPMMGGMMGNMMSGMLGMMLLGGLLVAALIAGGILLLSRLSQQRAGRAEGHPLGILDQRFARGEIDLEEYEQRYTVLSQRSSR